MKKVDDIFFEEIGNIRGKASEETFAV